jgi:hypothetical protein
MIGFARDGLGESGDEDPLEAYRDRAMYLMSIVGVVILLPLVAHNFYQGRDALAYAIGSVMLLLMVDAVALHRRKRAPIPYVLLLVPMAAAIGIGIKTQGIVGALWCSPSVLFFYFVLRRGPANLCSFSLLAAGTLMVNWWIGAEVAVRFFLSLALTIVIVNIILNIIGDLQRRLIDQAITDPSPALSTGGTCRPASRRRSSAAGARAPRPRSCCWISTISSASTMRSGTRPATTC